MYIPQKQLENLTKFLIPQKAVIIFGPRRCGKTTLLTEFVKSIKDKYLFVNGEDITIQNYIGSQSIEKLKTFIGENKLLIIDEAQKIKNIGTNLKLIIDSIKDITIIATGSSSFDLANNTGEPLTGRKYTLKIFPVSQIELNKIENAAETEARLENRLIYGTYPEIILMNDNRLKETYLREIVNSYLYKDILEIEGLKHSGIIVKLLRFIAFQIGKEVSYNELGLQLGISKNTVEKYLDLLEKVFVIQKIGGFSRNLRKEISKSSRYYFLDNGIRNALLNNFNPIDLRNDVGMLWENYLIMERLKAQNYLNIQSNNYFWRTYDKKEIDFVEERAGKLYGFEIKWGTKKKKPPSDWLKTYSNAFYKIINKDNYLEFITKA